MGYDVTGPGRKNAESRAKESVINTIGVDADRPGWRKRLKAAIAQGLKAPAFICATPWKGSAHITWVLARPINMGDPRQVRAYAAIRRMLVRVLDVDAKFSNRLTKNPFHVAAKMVEPDPSIECGDPEAWHGYLERGAALTYHTEIWELEAIELKALSAPLLAIAKETGVQMYTPKPIDPGSETANGQVIARILAAKKSRSAKANEKGRKLFNAVADWARHTRTGKYATIHAAAIKLAATMRSPAQPADIEQVATNVSVWMHECWWGPLYDDDSKVPHERWVERKPVDRNVMRGEAADLGPQALAEWDAMVEGEKQAAAALRSAEANRSDKDDRIRAAIRTAIREGGTRRHHGRCVSADRTTPVRDAKKSFRYRRKR